MHVAEHCCRWPVRDRSSLSCAAYTLCVPSFLPKNALFVILKSSSLPLEALAFE